MSRAFVKELDGYYAREDIPERVVSEQPNFVTARGLQVIDEALHRLEHEREQAKAADDAQVRSRVERDLRYWQQRKAGAKLVVPDSEPSKVRFGVTVVLQDATGALRQYTLVGEDEAEPQQGVISWTSPVAQALLGHEIGDEIELQGSLLEIVRLKSGH